MVHTSPRARPELEALLQGTPFRALSRLGRGGMGEIYEAVGPFGGEPVVVKLLRADLSTENELVERLRREAEMLRFLTHPNIVVSHGYGTTPAGRPYIVLERLVGATLREELTRRGAFPVREAVGYVRQLLSALARVHDAGVVHRDVKPSNVMICPHNGGARVKLIDFGVAKVFGDARRHLAPVAFPTREGVCLGTPRYVAPEQVSGCEVDRRSDIYAAGMLLYALVAGRGPFDDIVGIEHLLAAHLQKEAPPPSRFMGAPLAPALEAVILRAIAKNPGDRFADAAAFAHELRRATSAGRGRRGPIRRSPSHRLVVAATYAQRGVDRCELRAVASSARSYAKSRPDAALDSIDDAITVVRSEGRSALHGRPDVFSPGPTVNAPPAPVAEDAVEALWFDETPSPDDFVGVPASPDRDRVASLAKSADERATNGCNESDSQAIRAACSRRARELYASISRRGVCLSAVAFFAVAVGLAMWFVR